MQVLVILRRTDDDQGILIVVADHRDDRIGEITNLFPVGVAVRFVADLVDDIRDIRILFGDAVEKIDRLFKIDIGIFLRQGVPVHQDIHVVGDGRLDAGIEDFQTLPPIFLDIDVGIHRQTDEVAVPLLRKLMEKFAVDVVGIPGQAMRGNTAQLHDIAVFIDQARVFHVKKAVFIRSRRKDLFLFCCDSQE